jgi:hypothetical protein
MNNNDDEVQPGTYCVLCAETEGEHDGECVPNNHEYTTDNNMFEIRAAALATIADLAAWSSVVKAHIDKPNRHPISDIDLLLLMRSLRKHVDPFITMVSQALEPVVDVGYVPFDDVAVGDDNEEPNGECVPEEEDPMH